MPSADTGTCRHASQQDMHALPAEADAACGGKVRIRYSINVSHVAPPVLIGSLGKVWVSTGLDSRLVGVAEAEGLNPAYFKRVEIDHGVRWAQSRYMELLEFSRSR
ncbi:hypothetical protein PCANC_19837 [Puccinia coronata f. sp. avenae]|uniref:Uncharacterized protein n=1 Tax=Puccinia coronata f. sp. avenae TaxID=200324 RepID=A0A2N5UC93_9BASI|nr:hypothetical protein PCASD_22242 [Puccinia coronata f. sp. avenae]PLW35342.1 hypothetical protein PCANC_19837 [Puccinia coronata f. sp. avenae]